MYPLQIEPSATEPCQSPNAALTSPTPPHVSGLPCWHLSTYTLCQPQYTPDTPTFPNGLPIPPDTLKLPRRPSMPPDTAYTPAGP